MCVENSAQDAESGMGGKNAAQVGEGGLEDGKGSLEGGEGSLEGDDEDIPGYILLGILGVVLVERG